LAVAFGRKTKTIQVELSEETRAALAKIDNDLEALVAMLGDLVENQARIVEIIRSEVAVLALEGEQVDEAVILEEPEPEQESEFVGVEAFVPEPDVGPGQKDKKPADLPSVALTVKGKPAPPSAMQLNKEIKSDIRDEDRVRATPFTRAPRSVQITWLKKVMADGNWYGAVTIAREYATDERHYRYLRHAVGGRMKEMHEEGEVERRDSHVKGSMFEYRLKPKS